MAFNLSAESVKPQNRHAEKKTGWLDVEYSHKFYKTLQLSGGREELIESQTLVLLVV